MQQAAAAAAAAMRSVRADASGQKPGADVSNSENLAESRGGAAAEAGKSPYGAVGDASKLKAGEWGKLPKKVAEQMTQGQRESVAGEYRSQVEMYYRVIAEKAKKP